MTRAIRQLVLIVTVTCTVNISAFAQLRDHKGTEFWLAFPLRADEIFGGDEVSVTIVADANVSGTVSIPATEMTAATVVPFSVAAAGSITVQLPLDVQVRSSDGIERKGIHVVATGEVSVIGLNREGASGDAFLALPVDVLGREYIVTSYPGMGSEVAVVATEDATRITVDRRGEPPYEKSLNRGDVYQLRLGNARDLSGTQIQADRPVAVFSANEGAGIARLWVNYLIEQSWPVTSWGTRGVVGPLVHGSAPRLEDTYRLYAGEDGIVWGLQTLNRGDVAEFTAPNGAAIMLTKRMQLVQYSQGGDGTSPELGDPFMMLVPDPDQFLSSYVVESFSRATYTHHFINVVIPRQYAMQVVVDGEEPELVAAFEMTDDLVALQLFVESGTHVVSAPVPFGAWVYGYGDDDGYGYPAGVWFGEITADLRLDLAVASSVVTGSNLTLRATATNSGPAAAQDAKVRFTLPVALTAQAPSEFSAGTIAPGASVSFEVTASSSCTLADGTLLGIEATVTSAIIDPNAEDNTSTASVAAVNPPPVLSCPADVTVTTDPAVCTANAEIPPATYTDNCTGVAVVPTRSDGLSIGSAWPLGTTAVTWHATDSGGATASCSNTVTVTDDEPPRIAELRTDRAVLWPPNQKMVDVKVEYGVSDNCGDGATCRLEVTSNEAVNGLGDGDKAPDWEILDVHTVRLRAERSGVGSGRIYSIVVICSDPFGNESRSTAKVSVPHNR